VNRVFGAFRRQHLRRGDACGELGGLLHRNKHVVLTDDQQSRLETIFRGNANDLIDLKAEVEKSNIALRGELDRPQLDRAAIRRIAVRLNDARARLFERELMMLVDMRSVLNDTQWNRLRSELDRINRGQQQQRKRGQRHDIAPIIS